MDFKIKNIILYPRDKNQKPRFITFSPDKINIITGYSQKGKSAIISILDYCLASSECNIPIGLIRQKVDKFAIYISINNRNFFIARNSPLDTKNTDVMFFQEVEKKDDYPEFNTNSWIENEDDYRVSRTIVKNFLSNIIGLENISDEALDETKDEFASFRDIVSFLFQPQNIIANPTTIFYKTDTFEHLRKLKMVMPLVLGYKSYEIIKKEKELASLQTEHQKLDNKFNDILLQYKSWKSDIYKYYSEAISLGLTKTKLDIENSSIDAVITDLKIIIQQVKSGNYLQKGSSVKHSELLMDLNKQRQEHLITLRNLRFELYKYEEIDQNKNSYFGDVLADVDNKLKPISWYLTQKGNNTCPLCDSNSDKAVNKLLGLKDEQDRIKPIIKEFNFAAFSFEKEKDNCKRSIKTTEQTIIDIDDNINILLKEQIEENNKISYLYEYIGKIENVLENIAKLEPSSEMSQKLKEMSDTIEEKKNIIEKLKKTFDREASLFNITKYISKYIKILPIEDRNNKKVLLDPDKSVSIRVEDIKSRDITFLSRIGSGANHMCYHLATMLGLHEFFQSLTKTKKKNYIPSFLVLDQPSQVYYAEDKDFKKRKDESSDFLGTRAIFEACSAFMQNTESKTQIIILEHAPSNIWDKLDHIELVETWREKSSSKYNALIPEEWLA